MKTITTPKGEIRLLEPPSQVLRTLRSLLPFGFVGLLPPVRGAEFGIVMKCGDTEACAVKQQPPDTDEQTGDLLLRSNIVLVAHALQGYRQNGFGLDFPPQPRLDNQFGPGFTTMITSFMRAWAASISATGLPYQSRIIGLEIRKRLQLGDICFGFLAVGPHLFCIKTHLDESDPTWLALQGAGVTELYHLPSVPFAIDPHELAIAKPGAKLGEAGAGG